MRRTTFFKLSPGGNTTLLLVDENFLPRERAAIAAEVLDPLHLHAEQVGFVDLKAPRLEMAGGEFCLNATRALGALLGLTAWEARPAPERPAALRWRGTARVSGMPVPALLEVSGDAARIPETDAAVFLDLPSSVPCEAVAPGAVLVRLPGIVHLLLDRTRHPFPDDWQAACALWRRRFDLEKEPAAGCVWWHAAGDVLHADPVVRVKEPYSLCRETSCGSGALALALARETVLKSARSCDEQELRVMQPSGVPLRVRLSREGNLLRARVGGPVRLLARGDVFTRH